ncbi:MAG TPA: hypothetical protein VGR97_09540 [Candidatus Acidoferrales bacterium]|nr:hypothetical protein [Candidatus Acidoferrales bacterium]
MKLNVTRSAARLTLFAAALLATALFAGSANAQSLFKGKFTLQHETRWGQALLPAGHYILTFDNKMSNMLVVRDANSLHVVAYEPANIRQDSTGGESALLITVRGPQQIVHSLRIAELGQVFIYDRALANGREVEEARQSQAVPVIVAKK